MTVKAVELERTGLQVERNESRRDLLLRVIERRREGWANRMISLRCLASPRSPIAQSGHSDDSHSRTNGRAWWEAELSATRDV